MLVVQRLIWDEWNIGHIARHGVLPDDVEAVCHSDPIVSETYNERLRVIGRTDSGVLLTVILAPEGDDVYYVVTARPASRKERQIYRARKAGETP